MKNMVKPLLLGVSLAFSGTALAVVTPIHIGGMGTTYSLAYQDAVAGATAICSDSGGTITHVEELSAEQISANVWLVNITALCAT